jgi:hypothetical protein
VGSGGLRPLLDQGSVSTVHNKEKTIIGLIQSSSNRQYTTTTSKSLFKPAGMSPRDAFITLYKRLSPLYKSLLKQQRSHPIFSTPLPTSTPTSTSQSQDPDSEDPITTLSLLLTFTRAKVIHDPSNTKLTTLESTIDWYALHLLMTFERLLKQSALHALPALCKRAYMLDGGFALLSLYVSSVPLFTSAAHTASLVRLGCNSSGNSGSGNASGSRENTDFAVFMDRVVEETVSAGRWMDGLFPKEMKAFTVLVVKVLEECVGDVLEAYLISFSSNSSTGGAGAGGYGAGVGVTERGLYLQTLVTAAYCCRQFVETVGSVPILSNSVSATQQVDSQLQQKEEQSLEISEDGGEDEGKQIKVPVLALEMTPVRATLDALFWEYTKTYMAKELEYISIRFDTELKKWNNRVTRLSLSFWIQPNL